MHRANRSGQLQDRGVQSVAQGQGLFHRVQAAGLQPQVQHQCGAVPAEDREDAPDSGPPAVLG